MTAKLSKFHNLGEIEAAALPRMPRFQREQVQGGAQDGLTLKNNRTAFERLRFVPRVLVDTSTRHPRVQTLSREWDSPFGIAPMGAMGLVACHADQAMARAAARTNIPFVLSGASLVPLEQILKINEHTWFQAYLDEDQAEQTRLVNRVKASGCTRLVVTVDVPVGGLREHDLRNGYRSPIRPSWPLLFDGLTHPRWLVGTLLATLARDGMPYFANFGAQHVPAFAWQGQRLHRRDRLDWSDVARLREIWPHHLVLKGVLDPRDAQKALELGIDGLIVSNHGGRQLDAALASVDAIAAVKAVSGRMCVMLDSGVRRGGDVLKAMALGASQVFLGRPFLYAAVIGGEAGVIRAIELLRTEILRDMALLGCVEASQLEGRIVTAASPPT
jgi:L-lactate dehydrogenase (cytochrome)